LPYFWWIALFLIYTAYWQEVFHWSVILTAVHMYASSSFVVVVATLITFDRLPIGVAALAGGFTGPLSQKVNPKWLILAGEIMVIVGSILFPFATKPDRYWPIVFPAFIIGSAGAMLVYTQTK
jgi:nitrate/nitrite transporter NarK